MKTIQDIIKQCCEESGSDNHETFYDVLPNYKITYHDSEVGVIGVVGEWERIRLYMTTEDVANVNFRIDENILEHLEVFELKQVFPEVKQNVSTK